MCPPAAIGLCIVGAAFYVVSAGIKIYQFHKNRQEKRRQQYVFEKLCAKPPEELKDLTELNKKIAECPFEDVKKVLENIVYARIRNYLVKEYVYNENYGFCKKGENYLDYISHNDVDRIVSLECNRRYEEYQTQNEKEHPSISSSLCGTFPQPKSPPPPPHKR